MKIISLNPLPLSLIIYAKEGVRREENDGKKSFSKDLTPSNFVIVT